MDDVIREQQAQNKKLEVFIGKWHTTGEIYDDNGMIGQIDAMDTYEWLPGNYAVIHYADSNMGDTKIHGVEIIGYDVSRKSFFGPFFDNQGSVGFEELRFEKGLWQWYGENVMGVNFHRCTGHFKNADEFIALHEYSNDGKHWKKWMPIVLKKIYG